MKVDRAVTYENQGHVYFYICVVLKLQYLDLCPSALLFRSYKPNLHWRMERDDVYLRVHCLTPGEATAGCMPLKRCCFLCSREKEKSLDNEICSLLCFEQNDVAETIQWRKNSMKIANPKLSGDIFLGNGERQ